MKIEIPLYNILNMFLTGLVFVGGIIVQFPQCFFNLLDNGVFRDLEAFPETFLCVCGFAITYAIGEALNRAGSVFFEPVLKRIKIIPFVDEYELYNKKKKEFSILETLSREYAFSRTSSLVFMILFVIALIYAKWNMMIVFLALAITYILSCRKYALRVVALMTIKDSKDVEKC